MTIEAYVYGLYLQHAQKAVDILRDLGLSIAADDPKPYLKNLTQIEAEVKSISLPALKTNQTLLESTWSYENYAASVKTLEDHLGAMKAARPEAMGTLTHLESIRDAMEQERIIVRRKIEACKAIIESGAIAALTEGTSVAAQAFGQMRHIFEPADGTISRILTALNGSKATTGLISRYAARVRFLDQQIQELEQWLKALRPSKDQSRTQVSSGNLTTELIVVNKKAELTLGQAGSHPFFAIKGTKG